MVEVVVMAVRVGKGHRRRPGDEKKNNNNRTGKTWEGLVRTIALLFISPLHPLLLVLCLAAFFPSPPRSSSRVS